MNYSFDPLYQPYPSNRYCITAANGMVATGSALASSAGLEILKKGGNAVDAAVATAACLTVTEPCSNGIGSDAFALVWMKDRLYGLNASGYAPSDISIEKVKAKHGGETMPRHGWTPVTVPGTPKAWAALVKRFGALSLEEDLAPAIRYAEEGWPLSPVIAENIRRSTELYQKLFYGKPEFDEWFRTFTKDGEPYHFSEIMKLPNHARSLHLIAASQAEAFYHGEIADAMIRQSRRDGGFLSERDLSEYDITWVDPIHIDYRGYQVHEIPPNGQGITALMALNILKNFKFSEKECVDTYHKQFEAMKIAFSDSLHYVTDPRFMPIDYQSLLQPEYGRKRAMEITDTAALPQFGEPPKSGTVYLCTADRDGNMVSYIQSNYNSFGSGIVIEDYGIALQNRGADFSLDPGHVNCLMPGKRTYHTIIPGFLTQNGKAVGPFGVMGAYMQPQGHVQTIMNYIDFHMNPQQALDAPRWQWIKDKSFLVEPNFPSEIAAQLSRLGHQISIAADRTSFGRGEMIIRLDNGVLVGGCESRTDANIACF